MTGTNQRRYFIESELNKLISAARKGRYGQQDATLILLMARHGLRVSEAVDLEWSQIDFNRAHLHVRRLKGGTASVHPIQGDELRALRELRRQTEGAFVFASERGGPMTRFNVSKMIEAAGERAGCRMPTPTCFGIPTVIYWPMPGTTRGGSSCGLATSILSTPRTIRRLMPTDGRADWPKWLGEQPTSEQDLLALLRPCRDEDLKIWPVDKMVGNVKNNGPQLVLPVLSSEVPA